MILETLVTETITTLNELSLGPGDVSSHPVMKSRRPLQDFEAHILAGLGGHSNANSPLDRSDYNSKDSDFLHD